MRKYTTESENQFIKDVINFYKDVKVDYKMSSKEQDIKGHIDVIFKNTSLGAVDVKGLKKNNRSDVHTDELIHWLEVMNVNGHKGSIYGRQDNFAFEQNNDWMIVDRENALSFLKSKVQDFNVYDKAYLYKFYRRKYRKDKIVKVKSSDLRDIAHLIIPKR